MPQSICLICTKEITIEKLHESIFNLKNDFNFNIHNGEKYLQIEDNNGWHIYISNDDIIYNDLCDDYLDFDGTTEYFKSKLTDYYYFEINYNNYDVLTNTLKSIIPEYSDFANDIWIDNDYGLIISYKDFVNYLNNNIDWRIKGN